jgi:hypothetical protein
MGPLTLEAKSSASALLSALRSRSRTRRTLIWKPAEIGLWSDSVGS